MCANVGGRSNTCAYRTRLLIWSKTNSKISYQAVAEVAVFREAIMEEEETEEEVGQEVVGEEEAEVEGVDCAPTRISAQSTQKHDQDLH